jgi:hypothetical protein
LEAVEGFQLDADRLRVIAEFPSLRIYTVKLFWLPGSSVPQLIAVVLLVALASQYTPTPTAFTVPTLEIVLID